MFRQISQLVFSRISVLNSNASKKRTRSSKRSAKKIPGLCDLRLERLEDRALLSVSAAEYAAICEAYPALNLPENVDALNLIEIEATNLTVASLKDAIAKAGTTKKDDLIVVRTTDDVNKIAYSNADDKIEINIDSSNYGALNVVAFGTQPLTIDACQKSRVLDISSGTVGLANLTIKGGYVGENGAGVRVSGDLTTTNTTISGNTTTGNDGGGVYVDYGGSFTSTNTVISGNSAKCRGGGVFANYDGSFTSTNSTISGNFAEGSGGFSLTIPLLQ